MYVSPAAYEDYFAPHAASLLADLANTLDVVPDKKLSLQWDICQEALAFEGYFPTRPANFEAQNFALMGRLGNAVSEPVMLGYHLCYGTPRLQRLDRSTAAA